MSSERDQTVWNEKSVQEVSKQKRYLDTFQRHPKTDTRYWQQAVFLPTYSRNGEVRKTGEYAVKIQHAGKRETFALGTSNVTEVAKSMSNQGSVNPTRLRRRFEKFECPTSFGR